MKKNESTIEYRFKNFVKDDSNIHAYKSALAVAEHPNSMYNPLLIVSNIGLGKTHLLKSIENALIQKGMKKDKDYIYTDGYQIVKDSYNYSDRELFLRYTDGIKYLLIDDIYAIGDNQIAQEFLIRLINDTELNSLQLVFSSFKHPNDLHLFQERLKTRLQGGLVTEIKQPNYEFRKNFIKEELKRNDYLVPMLSEKSIDYIASLFTGDNRELKSCIVRIYAYAQATNSKITDKLVKEALEFFKKKRLMLFLALI